MDEEFRKELESGIEAYITGHMQNAVRDYVINGRGTGDFLRCVLANDLMGACGHADQTNLRALPQYAMFLYNYAPSGSYGSKEKRDNWIAFGGYEGRARTAALKRQQ